MESFPTWLTLLSPLATLLAAGLTKNVPSSLILGIITGSLLLSHGMIGKSLLFAIKKIGLTLIDPNTIILFAFLALLSLLIELMNKSGGVAAYVSLLQKRIKNARHAEFAVILFSFFFCIDDYINNMLTGAIIRPFAARFSIAREKIAFLLNSLSSPLVAIIPASTWAAMIITRIDDAGITDIPSRNQIIDADPFFTYLGAIPFSFYSIFIVISTMYIVYRSISYGSMAKIEKKALQLDQEKNENSRASSQESLASFLIPLACFLLFLPIFLLYLGNSSIFGGHHSILQALQNTNVMASLCYTSSIASAILGIFLLYQKKTNIKELIRTALLSIWGMRSSFQTLTLAFTLGAIISKDLHAGTYIATLISGNIPLILLPLIVFGLATLTTASTGSSWGTIALMMPISIQAIAALASDGTPISLSCTPLLYQTIGAILSGSVAGAHISPLTEATIISSLSAGANHLAHVKTQTLYAIPAILGAITSFIISSLTPISAQYPAFLLIPSLTIGLSVTIVTLETYNKLLRPTE